MLVRVLEFISSVFGWCHGQQSMVEDTGGKILGLLAGFWGLLSMYLRSVCTHPVLNVAQLLLVST